jgi:hypothetical protein
VGLEAGGGVVMNRIEDEVINPKSLHDKLCEELKKKKKREFKNLLKREPPIYKVL